MNTNTDLKTNILISGGGIAGLALACLLGRIGVDVTLLEPHPPQALADTAPGSRTSALMHGSVNILKNAAPEGWVRCLPCGAELQILRIIDDSARPAITQDFAASDIGLAAFGVNMPNNTLRAALWESAQAIDHIRILDTGLADFNAGATQLNAKLDDSRTIRAQLLVGADGRRSRTREIAGISCKSRDYGQSAITCVLSHSRPHNHISTEFHRPGGPFTLVPLPGNRSSLVWVEKTDDAARYVAMSRHALTRLIQDKTQGALGKIEMENAPSSWPLQMIRATKLTGPRVTLIAEAAHVLHPLGAQGLNLSLRDCAALAEILADGLRQGQDPGSASLLAAYERRRRPDIAGRIIGTNGLHDMITARFLPANTLRRVGLRTIGAVPPLKNLAMREGLTPLQQDSRLAAGEKL